MVRGIKAIKRAEHETVETMRTDLMKLQTYKLFEGEKDVYVKRDDVLKIFEKYTEGEIKCT